MRRISVWLGLGALGLLFAAPALGAQTAPTYVTSDPQNGSTVDSPPSRVSVTFSEPLDASSTLRVFDQCGRAVDAGDAQVLGSRIDVGIARTPSGHYTATYVAKGFAGATGETKGSFSFHVTSGEACDGGGHGGHDGHGDGDGDGGHGGHDGNDGEGHSGHSGDGNGEHHEETGASHSAHGGEGHDGAGGDGHDGEGHGGGHDGGRHGERHKDARPGSGGERDGASGRELAAGRGGPGLAPTSTSVLVALGLSIGMGALGGWVLRVSAAS